MKDWSGNQNSIYKTLGASNHVDHDRAENDFYATDPKAIDLLLTRETPSLYVWECACGQGHLAKRLEELKYNVISTDLIDRGYGIAPLNFFNFEKEQVGSEIDILTNPPYKFATEFVLKALELLSDGRKCYMFLKITFLEGQARFNQLFRKYPPQKIYVFSKRINCAINGKFTKTSGAVAYAWFVWQKGWFGPPTIEWLN